MARKIKFALEMANGAKVRGSIEELREHFDLEKAVEHFVSGKLAEWLADRYYENEAEALEAIDKDAPDLRARLCAAIGVPYEGDDKGDTVLDVDALERLNEKKRILRQKTSDEAILANADKTALTQEDLADLLDMDAPVIYLCGESFNIPARVGGKKYIGVLGTPRVTIKTASRDELKAKGITFENVTLPGNLAESEKEAMKNCPKCGEKVDAASKFCNYCGAPMDGKTVATATAAAVNAKQELIPKAQLQHIFAQNFKDDLSTLNLSLDSFEKKKVHDLWTMVNDGCCYDMRLSRDKITNESKAIILGMMGGRYTEDDLIHVRVREDMTDAWAFTVDSFWVMSGNILIPYGNIKNVTNGNFKNMVEFQDGEELRQIPLAGVCEIGSFDQPIPRYLQVVSALWKAKAR